MQIDQKSLRFLLSMSDDKLSDLLRKVARESGIAPESLGFNPNDIQSIRSALGSATDDDLKHLNDLYNNARRQNRGQ